MNNEKRFKICGVLRKSDCLDLLKDNMSYEELKQILQPNYNQLIRLMKSYNKKELQFLLYNTGKISLDKITTIIRKNAVSGEDTEIEEQLETLDLLEIEEPIEERIEPIEEIKTVEKRENTKILSATQVENTKISATQVASISNASNNHKLIIGEILETEIEEVKNVEHTPSVKKKEVDYKELDKITNYKAVLKYCLENKIEEHIVKDFLDKKRQKITQYIIKNGAVKSAEIEKINSLDMKTLYELYYLK